MNSTETLRELEQKLPDSSTRKNAGAVASLLTDDFQEFGSSGRVFSKAEIVAGLQVESERRISMRNFEARFLADDIALITYISSSTEPGSGPPGNIPKEALRSSLWVRRGGRWRMLFHQGTRRPPI